MRARPAARSFRSRRLKPPVSAASPSLPSPRSRASVNHEPRSRNSVRVPTSADIPVVAADSPRASRKYTAAFTRRASLTTSR